MPNRLTAVAQKKDILDATRVKDGVKVVLKQVPSGGDKLRMALYSSSLDMHLDP
jgi:hypothetical protein